MNDITSLAQRMGYFAHIRRLWMTRSASLHLTTTSS